MAIAIENAVKRFDGKAAVDGVSAQIEAGTFFVVLGAAGCGKSTLLRLIAGLETLDEGRIELGGTVVADNGRAIPPEKRNVGMVFQSYALWPHMSVLKNVSFPIETAGVPTREARKRASGHLKTVALDGFEDRLPASLSGGQRQRVALARCLAQGAKTVLMDEPLANLDPHLRSSMEEELKEFHERSGTTTIYITHDQREAMALADRMAVMSAGRFLQIGAPEDIYSRPTNETVARFIGRSAIVDADITAIEASQATLSWAGAAHQVACAPETGIGPARLMIRPDDVRLAGDAALSGKVQSIAYRGGVYEGWIATENASEARLPLVSRNRMQVGDALRFDITGGWVLPQTQA